uniref:Insulin-like domain-containing protein n=1 Tax=Acrobeloides nanus TaxID=290746 RepID=A0A914EEN0_9BILA
MPTLNGKKKVCGKRIPMVVRMACTPEGYSTPCFHMEDSDEYGNQINVVHKRKILSEFNDMQPILDLMTRKRRSMFRERRSEGIADLCCKLGCSLKDLHDWCCTDEEFERFKQAHGGN